MSEDPVLEDLPFDELKHRALDLAYKRHDVRFVLDLLSHTSSIRATADEGGSLGDFTGSVSEVVTAAREIFGNTEIGDDEPLFRARFATYIREHGG